MLIDTTVIASHPNGGQPLQVLAHRDQVTFADCSEVWLHAVQRAGVLDKFLRAVQSEGLVWSVFDLRRLSHTIERDILCAHRADQPGLVLYTLRLGYPGARAFAQRVAATQLCFWWRDVSCAA